jgi:ferredoxin
MPRVSIEGLDKVFDVNEAEILYDSLCDRGHELPHGCLAGSCGACKVEILSGAENLQMPGVIEKNTLDAIRDDYIQKNGPDSMKDKEIRLSCRAKVLGDVKIKPFK